MRVQEKFGGAFSARQNRFFNSAGKTFTEKFRLPKVPAMGSNFDQTEFVDTDFQSSKQGEESQRRPALTEFTTPPTRQELDDRVGEAQKKLAELRREQEQLERERAALEEARRRRVEYQNGREEMLQNLTRGIGLLEESEFAARRNAEQMSKSLVDLRLAMEKVSALKEESWTQENWTNELTKALTTLENARMEWNAARMKWDILNDAAASEAPAESSKLAALNKLSAPELARLGLALTWPLALVGLIGIVVLVLTQARN